MGMSRVLRGGQYARIWAGIQLVRPGPICRLGHFRTSMELTSCPGFHQAIYADHQKFSENRRHVSALATGMEEKPVTVGFDLVGSNGNVTKIHIRPSYAQKPKAVQNLLKSLPPLLTDAGIPSSAITGFGTQGWDLDESGDTIHRYVELVAKEDVDGVIDQINAASRELNHDPHIHIDGSRMTISCTTHVPPGLSMKDVKLAQKINDILANVQLRSISDANDDEAEILTLRQRGREQNMQAVKKAKSDCACG